MRCVGCWPCARGGRCGGRRDALGILFESLIGWRERPPYHCPLSTIAGIEDASIARLICRCHAPPVTRALKPSVLFLLLTCCGYSEQLASERQNTTIRAQAPGETGWWQGRDQYRNSISYAFGDPAETMFSGLCDGQPVFVLSGGRFPDDSDTFRLTVDDRSWDMVIAQDWEHGRALIVDDPAVVSRLAAANTRISFRVAQWVRELRPDPLIQRWVSECLEMRRVDPQGRRKGR